MAFLINAYNAFTVVKILQKYPNLKSIRDFGGLIGNPWKDKFFKLFGHDSYLDEVEHEMLRKRGAYDEPRVHFAVNCASVGCPMLREEAFVGRASTRNRGAGKALPVRPHPQPLQRRARRAGRVEDLRLVQVRLDQQPEGHRQGCQTHRIPRAVFSRYASLLSDKPEEQKRIAEGKLPVRYLDYDWNLNRAK